MKKFILKLIPYVTVMIIVMVVIPYVVDPYNVFHIYNMRNTGVTPNERIIKMKYILDHPDKYDAFVFGNSRVGSLHTEKIEGYKCYNMTYSVGAPSEFLKNIQTFIANGIVPKKIFIGLDNMSYMSDEELHRTDGMEMPYEYARDNHDTFFNVYFNPVMVFRSLKTMKAGKKIEGIEHMLEYGWWVDYGHATVTDDGNLKPTIAEVRDVKKAIDRTIEDVRQIKELCEENSIEAVFFTNPMHYVTYEECVKNWEYLYFMDELVKVTYYYNFSYPNRYTQDSGNFLDTSHYTAEYGDLIIEVLNAGRKDVDTINKMKYDNTINSVTTDDLCILIEKEL